MIHEDKILIPMTLEQHRYYLETYKEIQRLQSKLSNTNDQINKLKKELEFEQVKLQTFKKLNEESLSWIIHIQVEDKQRDWWHLNSFGRSSLNHINVSTNINPIAHTENIINDILYKQTEMAHYSSAYSYEKFLHPIKEIIEDELVENIEKRDLKIKRDLLSKFEENNNKLKRIPKWIRKLFKAI